MPVTLIENFRAVFYSPFYAAIALGAYQAEGVEVRLETSRSPEHTLQGLVCGAGQVSWGGPMRLLHALDADPQCGVAAFCEVVGRDPFFLVGREPDPGFRIRDLEGRLLATASEVPTPWYCLQHDLRLAGTDPARLRRAPPATMEENIARLRAGEVDAIQVFEPYATQLLREGAGYLWYAAATRGPVSYTTLNATRAFLSREPETALRMARAIHRTQCWIAAHESRELAGAVAPYFPHLAPETLVACIARYRRLGVWNRTPVVSRAGVEWLREAMLAAGAIRSRIAFEDVVETRFAEQALR
ncbi:MAG TPA: ABC transporter substrate-binding protein [Burkholderiales bacterium]|nr:ABC transporter substrate-binding protein [Burkholderiales bacterium]